jgi:hypothetical protein
VYFISDGEFIKIGRSDDYPIGRIGSLQTANARDLKLLAVIPGADRECHLHRLFSAHHVRREWFRSCREILDYIEAIPQT